MLRDTEFGKRLQALRNQKGLKQTDVAAKIGISYSSLQGHEGGRLPTRANLYKYADFFGCDIDWLITGRGKPFNKVGKKIECSQSSSVIDSELGLENTSSKFKLDEAIGMAVRILSSKSSYADTLMTNLEQFDRLIRSDEKISAMEARINDLETKYNEIMHINEDLKRRNDDLMETLKSMGEDDTLPEDQDGSQENRNKASA